MIFVDGPDGVGKTGYSQFIADELGWPWLEMRPVNGTDHIEAKSEVFNETLLQLHDQDIPVVVDRGPASTIVYSKINNREAKYSSHAEEVIGSIEPTIIFLSCDADELIARYDDELWSKRELTEIVNEYDEVMKDLSTMANVVEIDTTTGAYEAIKETIHANGVPA